MNIVLYFSPTGGTKIVAQYVAKYLDITALDLTSYKSRSDFDYTQKLEYTILLFPVFSQNIPNPVKELIRNLNTKNIIIISTYGRMGMGNVLYEVQQLIQSLVIGGAYIPTKHTYKDNDYFIECDKLEELLNRVKNKIITLVIFPKLRKHIFANFYPNLRSKIGVKINRTENCNNCSSCNNVCPTNSIDNGKINSNCIRCLSCYYNCPCDGLTIKYSKLLKMYLKKDKVDELIIY